MDVSVNVPSLYSNFNQSKLFINIQKSQLLYQKNLFFAVNGMCETPGLIEYLTCHLQIPKKTKYFA